MLSMVPRCPYCRAEPTAGTPVRADGGVGKCPICLEDVNAENRRAFPCSHEFCDSCLVGYYSHSFGVIATENEERRAFRQREVNEARRRQCEANVALRREREENAALQREIQRRRENAFLSPHLLQGPFDIGTIVTINVPSWQYHKHWQNKMEVNLRTARGDIACHWAARDKKALGNSKVRGKWQHEVKYDDAPSWMQLGDAQDFTMDIIFTESDWEVRFSWCENTQSYRFPRPSWLADSNDVVNVVELTSNLQNPNWRVRQPEV